MEIHTQKVPSMSANGELYWHVHKKSKKIKTRMEITSFFVISTYLEESQKASETNCDQRRCTPVGMLRRRLHLCKLVATMAATHVVIPGSPSPPSPPPPLDALRQQKKALRTLVRRQLRALPPLAKQQEDEAIQKHVLAADWFRNSQRVCAYVSCARLQEVENSKIMACLLQRQHEFPEKKVYVPRIEDKESHMCMLHITNTDEDLVANSMNILEPTPLMPLGDPRANMMQSNEPVDLFLLPGLAFDKKGGRLGRGGGYYDLFLQNYLLLAKDKGWKQPWLVALAYNVQIQEDLVPMTSIDINIDALVSCNGILPFSIQMRNTSSS